MKTTNTNNFNKQTIVNALAKYYATTLETMNKIYVHEKYDLHNNDQDLKKHIAFKGCEISLDHFTKREKEALAFINENFPNDCGCEWKLDPYTLAALMDGNTSGPKTFEQYMSEYSSVHDDVIYRTDVRGYAEFYGTKFYERLNEKLGKE